jgi:alanyl-tRNA synthetase
MIKYQKQDESGRWYAVLEETSFYPEGGGQPNDTGTLNGQRVIDVQEAYGEIRHYLEAPLEEAAGEVTGKVDWERRYDHMQQHAGQHLLSAAFEELFSYKTVSFHLGIEVSTIDLDTNDLTEEEALKAERLVNKLILENRPIETKWVTPEDLYQYSLRKELAVSENIRLVIIPDFDYNGCGGTHPSSTGGVGSLKILNWEKQRKMIRVTFVCGHRVLKQLHEKQKVISESSVHLNAPQQGMAEAIERILQHSRKQDKALKDAKEKLLKYEAASLASEAAVLSDRPIVKEVFTNRSIGELQSLARHITAEREDVNVFLVAENSDKIQFVCARGAVSDVNMKSAAGKILSAINGKGGGSENFAQGGAESVISGEQLIDQFLNFLK